MKQTLAVGIEKTTRHTIDKDRTIGFMGDDCLVYGTPNLLYDIEILCRDLLLEHSDEGEDSVGTRVELNHTGPTLLTMWVELTAKVTQVKGRAVTLEVTAKDALEQVADCKHSRFIVDVEPTVKRLKGKLAKAQAQ
ncbi:MAG: LysR family transcriptional regulator [Gammaproteobacteria bacterium]|nr:MAG: LysR family transcriptional regulator [Gammaproteobacteria bacterium]